MNDQTLGACGDPDFVASWLVRTARGLLHLQLLQRAVWLDGGIGTVLQGTSGVCLGLTFCGRRVNPPPVSPWPTPEVTCGFGFRQFPCMWWLPFSDTCFLRWRRLKILGVTVSGVTLTSDGQEQVNKYPLGGEFSGVLHRLSEGSRQDGTTVALSGHLLINTPFGGSPPSRLTSQINYLHPHLHLRVCSGGTQMKTSAIPGTDHLKIS